MLIWHSFNLKVTFDQDRLDGNPAHECGHAINFYFKQKVSYLKISQMHILYFTFFWFL